MKIGGFCLKPLDPRVIEESQLLLKGRVGVFGRNKLGNEDHKGVGKNKVNKNHPPK